MINRMRQLTLLGLSMVLPACAALPERPPTPRMQPASHYASAQTLAAPETAWPSEKWWEPYADPQLDRLIGQALASSPSLAVAEARLHRAEANVQVAASANRPQLSANSAVTEQKQSYNYLSPAAVTPRGWNDYGRVSLDYSWELDFWGRNRAALAAATSEADAARADSAQAWLTLSTAIASVYAELAREYAAADAARESLEVRRKTAELFHSRFANGLETLGGVRQAESARAAAEAEVLQVDEQLALRRNRLAALVGAGPDFGLAITRPTIDLSRPIGLPARIAADLLGRRPDVRAARMRAEAAGHAVDQAHAAFYPNVNLLASIGVQSLGLGMLTQGTSSVGSVGPAFSLPILTGGRLRGQLLAADADYAQAVANYDATVVQALQDVADAATSQKALGPELARTTEATDASRQAWRIQNNRYEGGLATYLEVLSAEDAYVSNLRARNDLQSHAFALDVALVRALGGGYRSEAR